MDVEQGLREYLEIKASVAYLENELNLLWTKGQAGAVAYGNPAVGDGMAGQEEGAHGGRARLAAKLESRRYMLRKLDALLSALDERERFVARKYYIEHMTWRDVVAAYNSEMQSPREVDALKAVRRRMLDKIERLQKSCS
jgi:DNA-directed RNA polymerase specialized sigma subunit